MHHTCGHDAVERSSKSQDINILIVKQILYDKDSYNTDYLIPHLITNLLMI